MVVSNDEDAHLMCGEGKVMGVRVKGCCGY